MKTFFLILFLMIVSSAYPQASNMTLLGNKDDYNTGGTPSGTHYSSCWGYTANGREYAIMGYYAGTVFYDITDAPSNIVEVGNIPGPSSFYNYRNIKVYSHYAYLVSEGGDGVQIVDLQYLPDSVHFVKSYTYTGFTRAHTVSQTGSFLYLNGGNNTTGGGITILDLADPDNPVKRGQWSTRYVHDCYVRNDTIFAACINDGYLSILDATDKDNITLVKEFTYPQAVTHNAWVTSDGDYLVVSNEGGSNHAFIWDIRDLNNIVQLSELVPYENSMVHNALIKGDSLYLAHYRAGVIVYNIADKSNPVEVGHYDTYPASGLSFQGCWNVYPYFESGKIIGSDMASGLYVLQMGTVTGIDPVSTISPDEYWLSQNYPNPFNPETKITFNIPVSGFVSLKVYDNLGREVQTLVKEERTSGAYTIEFKSDNLNSGVYFYKLQSGSFSETRKMVVMK